MKKHRFVQTSIISVLGLFIVAPLFISSCDGSDYDEEINGANTLAPRMMTRAGESSKPPVFLRIYGGEDEQEIDFNDGLKLHLNYSWNAGYTTNAHNNKLSTPKISASLKPSGTIVCIENGILTTKTYSITTVHAEWAGLSDIAGEVLYTIEQTPKDPNAQSLYTLNVSKTVKLVVDTTSVD